MIVMTNPVIGSFFSNSSFKLNKEGLYKKVYGNNNEPHLLFLTNNVRKVTEILDIDFDVIDAIDNKVDFYKLICSSPYTDVPKFMDINPERYKDCKFLVEFKNWLYDNMDYVIDGKLRTERVSEVLGIDIAGKVDYTKNNLSKYKEHKRDKMIGTRFIKELVDYDINNFNTDFKGFIKSKSELDHIDMVVNCTFEEILEEFKTFIKK